MRASKAVSLALSSEIRGGCSRGRAWDLASSATGVGVVLRPRPLRGLGCETIRPTSWGEEIRAVRMVAASSGVPANAIFKGLVSAVLGEEVFPPLAHGGLARRPIGAVEDQDAVEMIDLVLQDPGQHICGLDAQ